MQNSLVSLTTLLELHITCCLCCAFTLVGRGGEGGGGKHRILVLATVAFFFLLLGMLHTKCSPTCLASFCKQKGDFRWLPTLHLLYSSLFKSLFFSSLCQRTLAYFCSSHLLTSCPLHASRRPRVKLTRRGRTGWNSEQELFHSDKWLHCWSLDPCVVPDHRPAAQSSCQLCSLSRRVFV